MDCQSFIDTGKFLKNFTESHEAIKICGSGTYGDAVLVRSTKDQQLWIAKRNKMGKYD